MNQHTIVPIEIPDATREPAAYVRALIDALGDRDPLEVYAATPATAADIYNGLSDAQWHAPLAGGEWTAAQIIGHLFDVDIVYGFRWRLVLTEDKPAYPGYNEKLWSQLPRPDAVELLASWSGIRTANVALLRGIPPTGWKRLGTHGEQGDEQFDLMVDKIAGHDLAHLNQLARTVAAARETVG
jgi:hypothetical protein